MSNVVYVDNNSFEKEVVASEKLVLVDFWATWCGPCKMIAPILDEISVERSDVKVVKIDVDENQELAQKFGIRSIPTLYLMKDGKVEATKMGGSSKAALNAWIDSNM
jgi:thioredoxin 1